MVSRAESHKDQEAPLGLEARRPVITLVRGRLKGQTEVEAGFQLGEAWMGL